MYEKLPLDFIGLTDGFGSRKDPISNETSFHYGIDLGWHKNIGEKIYAIYDSKVVYEGYDDNLGNYIVLAYDKDDKTIIYRFLHLRDRTVLKKGNTVKQGQEVGIMGATGYTTGVHLHFEYWICPKGYTYNYVDRPKYAKNPFDYCYLFEDQEVSDSTSKYVIKVIGNNLKKEKDITKNQLEVVKDKLRCRDNYSLKSNILGYIDYGIYNFYEEKEIDGYIFYKIGENRWVANADNSLIIYKNTNSNENVNLKNYSSFTAKKDSYYYIYLKSNETIYFPK